MKCIVLDFENGSVKVFGFDKTQEDDIEEILTERYDYSLSNIEYMCVEELKIEID